MVCNIHGSNTEEWYVSWTETASCSLWNSPIFSKPIPFVTITKKLTSADLFCFQKPVILFHYCVPQGRLMLANFKLKVGITHYCGVISGFWNQIERNSLWIINQSVWMLISCCRFNAVMPLNLFFFFLDYYSDWNYFTCYTSHISMADFFSGISNIFII